MCHCVDLVGSAGAAREEHGFSPGTCSRVGQLIRRRVGERILWNGTLPGGSRGKRKVRVQAN
jgi:hypothetical protein